jgi:pyridoxal/pyridoxine/pyridoxamine kinase
MLVVDLLTIGDSYCKFKLKVPRNPRYFTGTGDLFSALILGWSAPNHAKEESEAEQRNSFKLMCETVVSTMQLVLKETSKSPPASLTRGAELRLVQSAKYITNPVIIVNAESI